MIAVGGFRGGFSALNALTGAVLWRFPTDVGTLAPPIAVADRIILGDSKGVLRAFGL